MKKSNNTPKNKSAKRMNFNFTDGLTNQKIALKKVKMYLCGSTLYDDIHVGNLRGLFYASYIKRFMKDRMVLVVNITDLDKKVFIRNKRDTLLSFVKKQLLEYRKVQMLMKINNIDFEPKVSANLNSIKEYADRIPKDESGDLIINNSCCSRLSNMKISTFSVYKKDKFFKEGFPGWHTECAYFMQKYFDGKVDIQMGGSDLRALHHQNSFNLVKTYNNLKSDEKPIKYFIWNGMVENNKIKMSKSMKNSLTCIKFIQKYGTNRLKIEFLLRNIVENMSIFNPEVERINSLYWEDVCCFKAKDTKKVVDFLNSNFSNPRLIYKNLLNFTPEERVYIYSKTGFDNSRAKIYKNFKKRINNRIDRYKFYYKIRKFNISDTYRSMILPYCNVCKEQVKVKYDRLYDIIYKTLPYK